MDEVEREQSYEELAVLRRLVISYIKAERDLAEVNNNNNNNNKVNILQNRTTLKSTCLLSVVIFWGGGGGREKNIKKFEFNTVSFLMCVGSPGEDREGEW